VHHRSTPRVDRADDLLGIDALQVNARRGHVRMPELTLDDGQRHPLARELDRVRMPKLVRREPSPDTSSRGVPAQLPAHGGRRPRPPASRSVDHAEQRPDGQLHTARESRSELIAPRPGVHPGLAALVTLAIRVRGSIRVAGRDRTRSTTTPPGLGQSYEATDPSPLVLTSECDADVDGDFRLHNRNAEASRTYSCVRANPAEPALRSVVDCSFPASGRLRRARSARPASDVQILRRAALGCAFLAAVDEHAV
jgi:hypothetical protein